MWDALVSSCESAWLTSPDGRSGSAFGPDAPPMEITWLKTLRFEAWAMLEQAGVVVVDDDVVSRVQGALPFVRAADCFGSAAIHLGGAVGLQIEVENLSAVASSQPIQWERVEGRVGNIVSRYGVSAAEAGPC